MDPHSLIGTSVILFLVLYNRIHGTPGPLASHLRQCYLFVPHKEYASFTWVNSDLFPTKSVSVLHGLILKDYPAI